MSGSDDGKRRLKDLARVVRDKVTPSGAPLLEKRGLDTVEELARELTAPDAMPGLKLWRDAPARLRLQRDHRNGEITVEFKRDIGAIELTVERAGQRKKQVRYVFDEGEGHWRPMEGGPDLYDGVAAALVECLYPEGRSPPP